MIRIAAFLFFISLGTANAQNHLDTLLQERKGLYTEYSVLKEQKSNFWGSQSKNDLRKIIENLKAIIRKDDEIVREVNRQHEEKRLQIKQEHVLRQTDYTLKDRNYTDRIYELNNQVSSLSQLNNKLVKENESLSKQTESTKGEKSLLESILLIGFVVVAGLIFYIRRLNKKLNKKPVPNLYK